MQAVRHINFIETCKGTKCHRPNPSLALDWGCLEQKALRNRLALKTAGPADGPSPQAAMKSSLFPICCVCTIQSESRWQQFTYATKPIFTKTGVDGNEQWRQKSLKPTPDLGTA